MSINIANKTNRMKISAKKSKVNIYVIGGAVVLALTFLGLYILSKNKKSNDEEDTPLHKNEEETLTNTHTPLDAISKNEEDNPTPSNNNHNSHISNTDGFRLLFKIED
tara:strand:+ start:268 stop:591 length:324 start_codon:yes stop_codon:yes gene_type:complete